VLIPSLPIAPLKKKKEKKKMEEKIKEGEK
jgi:hypothetical protein